MSFYVIGSVHPKREKKNNMLTIGYGKYFLITEPSVIKKYFHTFIVKFVHRDFVLLK